MKLRDKRTGKIIKLDIHCIAGKNYESLAQINEEWEDYEEPKEYWYIDYDGGILCGESDNSSAEKMMISMGNHFGTIKEAEKAVERLRAWKRLKDKGFRFTDDLVYGEYYGCGSIRFIIFPSKEEKYVKDDLELLFGGEE